MRWRVAAVLLTATGLTACGAASTGAPASSAGQSRAAVGAPGGLSDVKLTIFSPPAQTSTNSPVFIGPNQGGITCPQVVELASDRLVYTSDELGQMGDYLAKRLDRSPPAGLLQLTTVILPNLRTHASTFGCDLHLQITNTGGGAVEIEKAGLRITSAPQTNTQRYRLVDACSITGVPACQAQIGAGASGCDLYYTTITLREAASGDVVADAPVAQDAQNNQCPPITLAPQQSIEIQIYINGSMPLVYDAEPALVVQSGTAIGTVVAPQYAAVLPFASPGEFTCYQLGGRQFSARWTGNDAIEPPGGTAWCM